MCPSLKLGWRRSIDRTAAIAGKKVGSTGVSASAEIGANWRQQRIPKWRARRVPNLSMLRPFFAGISAAGVDLFASTLHGADR